MILFTYLCSKIFLLLNTPAAVGTTSRWRCNSRRGDLKQISRIDLILFGCKEVTIIYSDFNNQALNLTYIKLLAIIISVVI